MNQKSSKSIDLLIVGGGILGAAVAASAAMRGWAVHVLRLSDSERPRADTLRNQSWLQSGIMHMEDFRRRGNREAGLVLARRMFVGGRRMLRDLEIPVPDDAQRGILCVKDRNQADNLKEDARELKISKLVEELGAEEAASRLGALYDSSETYFTIPDVPFDEAAVLTRYRDIAVSEGAVFCEVDEPVEFAKAEDSACGFVVKAAGEELSARLTLAVSGAGNQVFFEQLGLEKPFSLQQTPLLVVPGTNITTAPIYADRSKRFSYVYQDTADEKCDGAMIVGTGVKRKGVAHCHPEERRILEEDVERFESVLPAPIKERLDGARYTAGREVIPNSAAISFLQPWLEQSIEFPTLMFGFPGRATLSQVTAGMIIEKIAPSLSGNPKTKREGVRPLGARPWSANVSMHYESVYSFNDALN